MNDQLLTEFRKKLHRHPELHGSEKKTAETVLRYFDLLSPAESIRNLGGHGLAFTFQGKEKGPTLLFRCDMDAVPVKETTGLPHNSLKPGVSHACGHDGHMTILAGVGKRLTETPPEKGRVILLYQPAEETGEGASAVIQDPEFKKIKPDLVFALHNLPGYPLGELIIKTGTFCCTSRGMTIRFTGKTAHASQPETGISPEKAMCYILEKLRNLPEEFINKGELILTTVVGVRLGEKAFGVSPDKAEIWVTLRCETDLTMAHMVTHLENMIKKTGENEGLMSHISYEDRFDATVNSQKAVNILLKAAGKNPVNQIQTPFRFSEDVGKFLQVAPGALFGLGAGEDMPDLHNPDYDFPDELIPAGVDIFMRIIHEYLGLSHSHINTL